MVVIMNSGCYWWETRSLRSNNNLCLHMWPGCLPLHHRGRMQVTLYQQSNWENMLFIGRVMAVNGFIACQTTGSFQLPADASVRKP